MVEPDAASTPADLPGFTHAYSGKVRDLYTADADDRLVLVGDEHGEPGDALAVAAFVPAWENHGLWAALMVSFAVRGLTLLWRYPALERAAEGCPG